MKVCYYENEELIRHEKSIFLAGPTPRDDETKGWREEAVQILTDLGYDGTVYVPERAEGGYIKDITEEKYKKTAEWELQRLHNSTVIVFWVPRELKKMPAFTTNVEFGFHINYNVVYGRPDDSEKNRYLDNLYLRECGKMPYNTLYDTLKEAVSQADKLNAQELELLKLLPYKKKKDKIYFTADTHFDSLRTLAYSYRPYRNVEDMNFHIVKNWNSVVVKDNMVYHLGDFGNYDYVKQLNGKVVLLAGNYELKDLKENYNNDKTAFKQYLISLGFYDVIFDKNYNLDLQTTNGEKVGFNLSHKPTDCNKTKFNLFGHIHEKCKIKSFGLNVDVDASSFMPISLEQVLFLKDAIENNYDLDVFCTDKDLK